MFFYIYPGYDNGCTINRYLLISTTVWTAVSVFLSILVQGIYGAIFFSGCVLQLLIFLVYARCYFRFRGASARWQMVRVLKWGGVIRHISGLLLLSTIIWWLQLDSISMVFLIAGYLLMYLSNVFLLLFSWR